MDHIRECVAVVAFPLRALFLNFVGDMADLPIVCQIANLKWADAVYKFPKKFGMSFLITITET